MDDLEAIEYLTVSEVAERLRVAESTIYKWISEGRIKAASFGRVKRIRREEFVAFIQKAEQGKLEED